MKKSSLIAVSVAAGITLGGAGLSPALAAPPAADVRPSVTDHAQPGAEFGDITADQWQEIARAAEADGDAASAEAARDAAQIAVAEPAAVDSDAYQAQGWGVIAKMAVKAALKYGKPFLPDYIRPIADELYELMDKIGDPTEKEFVELLIDQGVEADRARLISKWVHAFI
ncbi:hypothetical protein [Brevibacterium gallinarum]|uniref:Secreted protein n=1 Tax=Brevibacterium gallinarum TaxID=2762220 RepID=A0ABR8WVX3_9MICO|nr:hypothetical protein [Brevibacterium gallinarum]MBD8021239.1 hypothetical protein [Brevibacterium gallinarum]